VPSVVKHLLQKDWELSRFTSQLRAQQTHRGDVTDPVVEKNATLVTTGPIIQPTVERQEGLQIRAVKFKTSVSRKRY